jgi:outer membrane protein OmpA-like peptidoglycan-associated protein
MKKTIITLGLASILVNGCAVDPRTGQTGISSTAAGGGIGAAVGAGAGTLFGGNDLVNAGLGALAGGAVGAGIGYYMDQQQQDMQQSLQGTGIEVQRTADNQINLNMPSSSSVTFASGKTDLNQASQAALDAVAQVLTKYPESTIVVTGHTDDVGADADNQRLSEARATSVGRYLVQRGVNAQRITQQGMGEIAPKLTNTSETNRAANRRVELAIKANNNAGANNSQTQPNQGYPTTNQPNSYGYPQNNQPRFTQ